MGENKLPKYDQNILYKIIFNKVCIFKKGIQVLKILLDYNSNVHDLTMLKKKVTETKENTGLRVRLMETIKQRIPFTDVRDNAAK